LTIKQRIEAFLRGLHDHVDLSVNGDDIRTLLRDALAQTLLPGDQFSIAFDLLQDMVIREYLQAQFADSAPPHRHVAVHEIRTHEDQKEIVVTNVDEAGQPLPGWEPR
jgi:hypothetical protein